MTLNILRLLNVLTRALISSTTKKNAEKHSVLILNFIYQIKHVLIFVPYTPLTLYIPI